MIKYANFHWRQWPGSTICGASSLVMQGQLKNTQSYTYGRLRAFHRYQMQYFDAPDVVFAWGGKQTGRQSGNGLS